VVVLVQFRAQRAMIRVDPLIRINPLNGKSGMFVRGAKEEGQLFALVAKEWARANS
jgi:hypothetical protein